MRACDDELYAVAAFKAWDAKVRASVPSRQLLVFETGKHGYKELAHFLGVKEPAEPYPRTNSRSEFAAVIDLTANQGGIQYAVDHVERTFQQADIDGSGFIDLNELILLRRRKHS